MSAEKGQKIIYLSVEKTKGYMELVKKIKKETRYQGMSFSKMCDLGSEIIADIYNQLTKEEIKSIIDGQEFNEVIKKKIKIK